MMQYSGKLFGKISKGYVPLIMTSEDVEKTQSLLRETVMRANLALPETSQDLVWFDEGVTIQKSGDFFERIVKALDLGKIDELKSK
jgi:hypothetical protein